MFNKCTFSKINKSSKSDDLGVFIFEKKYVIKIKKLDRSINKDFYIKMNDVDIGLIKPIYRKIIFSEKYILFKYDYIFGKHIRKIDINNLYKLINVFEELNIKKYYNNFFIFNSSNISINDYFKNKYISKKSCLLIYNKIGIKFDINIKNVFCVLDKLNLSLIIYNLDSYDNLLFIGNKLIGIIDINYGVDYKELEIINILISYGYFNQNTIKKYRITKELLFLYIIREIKNNNFSDINKVKNLINNKYLWKE